MKLINHKCKIIDRRFMTGLIDRSVKRHPDITNRNWDNLNVPVDITEIERGSKYELLYSRLPTTENNYRRKYLSKLFEFLKFIISSRECITNTFQVSLVKLFTEPRKNNYQSK